MTFTRITGHSRYTMQNVVFGRRDAPILVICDSPPSRSWIAGQPMPKDHMDTFGKAAIAAGLKKEDFCFIVPCPSIPPDKWDSERLKAEWLAQHKEEFEELLTTLNYRAVVVSGNLAARQYIGRAVKITKVRGLPLEHKGKPCLPIMSVGYISKVPEKYPMFQADMATLKRLKDARYIIGDMAREQVTNNYKYTFDLSEFIDNPPKIIAVDTETTGLIWHKDDVYPFLAQLTKKQGESYLVPLSERYIPDGLNPKDMVEAKRQLKQILENPNIHKVGHNFKFDLHMLRKVGIEVKGWRHDTMQLAYAADENMISYGLDDCVKVWVPEMAGYDDELARNYDKSRMIEVPFDVMRQYAGGDTDACFRLCRNLIRNLSGSGNYERYTKIVMPSLLMFGKVTEKYGLKVDESKLVELKQSLQEAELQQYEDLISAAPPSAKRNAIKGGYANIGSPKFVREILFSEDGFGLRPRVFTKAGREPSISTKDHLVYFEDNEWVQRYIDYVKLHKLNSTYVTDFDKYITNSTIHPSFLLHRTNTGRVASENPNGQNFPKRGKLAKDYRKMFVPRDGYVIIEADYAQVELKIAAVMSGDPVMLNAYRTYGDLHTLTAANTMGMTLEQFRELSEDMFEQKRFEAKAINFGFIYGMLAKGFKTYAKTQYKIDYTEQQSEAFRNTFMTRYNQLPVWHKRQIDFAHKHGYVESLHGVKRHLPSIHSKDFATVSLAERQAVNAPVQLLGSDMLLMASERFTRDTDPDLARVVLTVHDAAIVEAREDRAREMASALKWYMENNPLVEWFNLNFPITLDADVKIGPSYGEVSKVVPEIEAICPDYYNRDKDILPPVRFLSSL